jgi:uncharacterized protein YndB with AHSA1/START domain
VPFASCAASLQERLEPMPGDDLVADAVVCATHAICVRAPPERVWPWLAQMGARRAGWYSHDWIDNGGAPSAEEILPDLQRLAVGDVLAGTPVSADGFLVVHVAPPRRLVLVWPAPDGGCNASWAFVLRASPQGDGTRLLVRARLSRRVLQAPAASPRRALAFVERIYRALPHVPEPIVRAMAALGHGFMQTKQLRGIKHRAEAHPAR